MEPPRAERVWGVVSVARSGLEKHFKLFSVREDQSLYTPVKEWVVWGENYSKQSYRGAPYWLRDCACMTCLWLFWGWLKTWKLECSNPVLKRKLRATHRVRRRVPRKTGDGACGDSGGGTVGVERIGSDGKPETFSLIRARRPWRKVLKLEQHVTIYQGNYCCIAVRV